MASPGSLHIGGQWRAPILYIQHNTITSVFIFILCIVYNVHSLKFFRYYLIIQCLELGASQQSFALASEILTTQGEQELGRKQALCPDCAVISQGFYSRSEKLNTNFYRDSAEVRHLGTWLGTWAGQLSGIQSGPGSGVRVPRRVVTQLIGGSWGRKLGSSSPVVIMQPVRNQFELLKVSTNGSLPLPPLPVQESGSRWWWLAAAGLPWSPELDFLLPPLNHAHRLHHNHQPQRGHQLTIIISTCLHVIYNIYLQCSTVGDREAFSEYRLFLPHILLDHPLLS